jgi:patatin-like phospholipase/acyl hydrolase
MSTASLPPYRILSIDGGGIRGLIPATILTNLERRAGKPVGQLFDLVAGTSTGGIIAAAIAASIPMDRVRDLYRKQGEEIFSRSAAKRLASLGGLTDEKYPADGLERCLRSLFQDRRLSETSPDLLITSCTLSGAPHFFKGRKAKKDAAEDYFLVDVCRATSAAPTYFPPAEITDVAGQVTRCLVDGGLVANNPAMCAVAEAYKRGELFPWLISIGTGADETPISIKDARHCGLLSGGTGVIKMVFNGPGNAVDYQCRGFLGEQYFRLQAALPGPMGMDATDESSMAILEDLTSRICESPEFERVMKALGIEAD